MTTTPTAPTLNPWKHTLRTVLVIAIAIATATPFIVLTIQGGINVSDGVTAVLTQIVAVAAIVTRLAASPLGNQVFGWIGLDIKTPVV